jgi:ketosteroid isomerase-like protein
MKRFPLVPALLLVIGTMSFSIIPSSSSTTLRPDDHQAIMAANAQFYTALNEVFKGKLEPMTKVWSHAGDVTYMGPVGGFQKGWDAVLENWTYQAEQKLGGDVEPEDIHINAGPQIAVVHNLEKGTNVVDGETQVVSIRATNIFRKEKGKWKMIGHHTDLLPFF